MPQESLVTKAEVYTAHHCYSGSVLTRGYRLADLLNDPATELIEMRDVRISQPFNANAQPMAFDELLLKKDSLQLVIPTGPSHEAPVRRLYTYIDKPQYTARIVLPAQVLVGMVHLPDRANPMFLLRDESTVSSFIAVTDVTVYHAIPNTPSQRLKTVICRRKNIESLHLSAKPNPKPWSEAASELGDLEATELAQQLDGLSTDSSAAEPAQDTKEQAEPPCLLPFRPKQTLHGL